MWSPCTFHKSGPPSLADCLVRWDKWLQMEELCNSVVLSCHLSMERVKPCLSSDLVLTPELGTMDSGHVVREKHPLPKERQQ